MIVEERMETPFDIQEPVIDLGAGENADPRADYTTDLHAVGVDFTFDLREEWPFPDNSVGGLIARHVFEHFTHETLREHVFPEAARVLCPGGWLEIAVPVGSDLRTDPTHKSVWEWRTPLFYGDSDHHWVGDNGLSVESRELDVWTIDELKALNRFLRPVARRWPCEFWYELPGTSGEITARYVYEGES